MRGTVGEERIGKETDGCPLTACLSRSFRFTGTAGQKRKAEGSEVNQDNVVIHHSSRPEGDFH
jgi:hypothetical protein